jgi:hypothetical protein
MKELPGSDGDRHKEKNAGPPRNHQGYPLPRTRLGYNLRMGVVIGGSQDEQMWANMRFGRLPERPEGSGSNPREVHHAGISKRKANVRFSSF